MLKITPRDRIKVSIEGFIPGAEIGKDEPFDFIATWKVLSSTEYKSLIKENTNQLQAVQDNLLNLEGVLDENGKEIKFSPDLVAMIFEIIPVKEALVKSLVTCQTVEGQKAIKAKN